jgi:hypothetical protein
MNPLSNFYGWLMSRVHDGGHKALAEIASFARDEPTFQRFFTGHPQILDPMASQVWSQPDFHGAYEPDFVIRRADDSYLIVEIETPGKQIITLAEQLSASAAHAEKQATDYRRFLSERVVEARNHFSEYLDADCLVIIGLENRLTQPQANSLANVNASRHRVRIAGFDWIASRAHAIIENMSSGEVGVFEKHRIG